MNLALFDIGIIALYLLVIIGVGVWLSRRESVEAYFVNDRNTSTGLLVFTLVSTAVGAGTLIGTASEAFRSGISFPLSISGMLLLGFGIMAWLAPRIKRWADEYKAYTLGDYVADRFSERTRLITSSIILIANLLLLAVQFVAFARLLESIAGVPYTPALLAAGTFTIIYTTLAGLRGVFYTDAVQFVVMIFIFGILAWFGAQATDLTVLLNTVPEGHFDVHNYAGPVFFYGAILVGIPYVLVSMEIWQRIFAAADVQTVRRTFILAIPLYMTAYIAAAVFGFMALQVVPDAAPDTALFALMQELLPTGLLGLGVASVLAVLMSTVDSFIMIGSAILTKDILPFLKKEGTTKDGIRYGRYFAIVYGVASLMIAVLFPDIVQLLVSGGQIVLVFAPAVIGGLVWSRVTEPAAFWSIVAGLIPTILAMPFLPNLAIVPGTIISLSVFFFFVIRAKS